MESRTKNKKRRRRRMRKAVLLRNVITMTVCGLLTLGVLVGSRLSGAVEHSEVYAADSFGYSPGDSLLSSGLSGVVNVISNSAAPKTTIERFGTSCEEMIVGQRVQHVSKNGTGMNMSSQVKNRVHNLNDTVSNMAASPKLMSDYDYDSLLRIVEAEAGTEDLKGRILIVNVIMNRLKHPEFPNTVAEVILESRGGVAQFSPTYDGTFYSVSVSNETRQAVRMALEGTDYSEGALFFVQRSAADKKNVSWFDTDLERLFQHGVHEFYKYPGQNIES